MSPPVVGVYGKIDTQGDFVRAGSGGFARAGLDRWLEEGVGLLKTQQLALPDGPSSLLFAPAGAAHAFLGALAPSEDSVGRRFPLLVFLELPASQAAGALAATAASYAERFLAAAGELVAQSRGLTAAELLARAQQLAALAPTAAPNADEAAALMAGPSEPLRVALGGGAPELAYALRTVSLACSQAAKADAAAPGLTIDAPAPSPAARAMWLELAARRLVGLGGAATPSTVLWSGPPGDRLLFSLGPPSPSVLPFWASPKHRSQRLWPLRTEVAAARATALEALGANQRRAVEDRAASLAALAREFL